MDFLSLLLILAFIGIVTWGLLKLPLPQSIKNIILVVAVVTCALMALNAFGVISALRGIQVPRVR